MSKYSGKKFLAMILAMLMIMTCLVSPAMATPSSAPTSTSPADRLTQSVSTPDGTINIEGTTTDLNEDVTIMVQLEGQTTFMQTSDIQLASANHDSHMATIAKAENRIEATLGEAIEVKDRYSLLFNGFSFVGEAWMVDAINEMDGISCFVAPVFELVEPTVDENADLTPSMSMSTGLTTANLAWDMGYTGEGMTVAVIDTGIRQTHEVFSVMPENGKIDPAYLRDVYTEYGDVLHAGSLQDINDIYYSEKLPFNWDYFDNDAVPNHTASDHGTHVAGIAAGNNGKDFKGVAPDAQIVAMQVFRNDGAASFSTVMLALEDCIYLGVDAINMSLGASAYFSGYESISSYMEVIYDALENAGVAICTAAGNDTVTGLWNNYADYWVRSYRWGTKYLDVGTVSAPATFPGSLAVASVDNSAWEVSAHLKVGDAEYYQKSVAYRPTFSELEPGEYEVVYVGLCTPEEIEAAGGVEGKIALTLRGSITFSKKATNAINAGAIGILTFNTEPGMMVPIIKSTIPVGCLSREDALDILATFADGVHGSIEVVHGVSYGLINMSEFSSWGTTADLLIKPEISAPGGNIRSAVGFGDDASYGTWGGTSMAAPHIAGGMLLLKQHLQETFPDKTAAEINALAHNVMMSTSHQVAGFVRQQGAGLMDVAAAVTTDTYLSVDGGRPKLELDDSENGEFTFSFEVTNFGDTDRTYSVTNAPMTANVGIIDYSGTVMGDRSYFASNNFRIVNPETVELKIMTLDLNFPSRKRVETMVTLDGPKTINVAAGETIEVTYTLSCNDDLMAWIEENCEAGNYLEGYIKLNSDDGVDLSIPYLGFVGDWDYAPMFDEGFWWNLPYGVNNLAQNSVTQGTYVGYGPFNPGRPNEQGLGLNPYWDMNGQIYHADRNAISPNGDDYLDALTYMEFAVMRNPKTVKLFIADEEGNVIRSLHESTYSFRKEYYDANGIPSYSNIRFQYAGEDLAENETAYLVLEAYLDHEEYDIDANYCGRMVFPFTKDTTAPQVRIVDGGIEIVDAQYTAYYAVYADAEKTELIAENGVFATERGVAEFVETDLDTVYVVTADYARNEGFFLVQDGMVYDLGDTDILYSGKTIVGRQYFGDSFSSYAYSWIEFNSESAVNLKVQDFTNEMNAEAAAASGFDYLSAAIGANGKVYVNSLENLYTQNPETKELTYVASWNGSDGKGVSVYNLMVNPETYEMYGLVRAEDYGKGFAKLDVETGEVTFLWDFSNVPGAPWLKNNAWAACFIDGNTVAVLGLDGDVALFDAESGEVMDYFDVIKYDPQWFVNMWWVNGICGSALYKEDTNEVYLFTNFEYLGEFRLGQQGMVIYDLDTRTFTMRSVGDGTVSFHGLYFKEDVKPTNWYVVIELIDAIGEVTLNSKEAIEAARAAYDALTEDEKAMVGNYNFLVNAEQAYLTLVTEEAALDTAKAYALVAINNLKKNVTDECTLNVIEAAREAINNATTVEEVYAILDEVRYAVENGCVAGQYTDVSANAWYHESIEFVVASGLMNGISETIFAPNANMTRAELVTVLYRLAGEPSVDGLENPFADIVADTWYTDAVIWAANEGVVNGMDETIFAPKANVTREQIAAILYRYTGAEAAEDALAGYADSNKVSDWAVEAMNWAVSAGLINGMTETALVPQGNATRAQIAAILMRYCEG